MTKEEVPFKNFEVIVCTTYLYNGVRYGVSVERMFRVPAKKNIHKQSIILGNKSNIKQRHSIVPGKLPGNLAEFLEAYSCLRTFPRELRSPQHPSWAPFAHSISAKLTFRYVNFALMIYVAIKSKHLRIVGNCNALSTHGRS